jgi:DNA repair exonuclease SbcCD ATPase subunit
MSDLLNTLGKKSNSVEGAGKASEPQPVSASVNTSTPEHGRGDDLLAKIGGKESQVAEKPVTSSAESGHSQKSASGTEEPTGGQNTDWTTDSALKEVKKLREENKAYRLKYQQEVEKLSSESDARLEQQRREVEALKLAKQELDKIKAEQEDKKRDLSEKLAHRESRLAELQAIAEAKEQEWSRKLSEQESIVRQYRAEREAEAQVYQSKVDEELSKIPVKFQDYAKLLVKGAGDSREALVALSEAKLKGMFDDKTVIVNHSVPTAHDGARASNERLQEAERQRRTSMNSSQKIGEALKQIKSGTPNNVFRTK